MVCLQSEIQIISIYTTVVKLCVKLFHIPHLLMKWGTSEGCFFLLTSSEINFYNSSLLVKSYVKKLNGFVVLTNTQHTVGDLAWLLIA